MQLSIKLRKRFYLGFISFIFFYTILIIFNLNSRIIFTHFIANYFDGAKQMMNFMFPYSISQGSWFGISFYAILFMLIFSLIFFILIFKYKKNSFNTIYQFRVIIQCFFRWRIFIAYITAKHKQSFL